MREAGDQDCDGTRPIPHSAINVRVYGCRVGMYWGR